MQIVCWCLFLSLFFSQEEHRTCMVFHSTQDKEFAFEANDDCPFHELNSDQSLTVITFVSVFRLINLFDVDAYETKGITTQRVFSKIHTLHSFYISQIHTETVQLRC